MAARILGSLISGDDSLNCWKELLRSIASGILSTLVVNCTFLAFVTVYFSQPEGTALDKAYSACANYALTWLLLNLIALLVMIYIQITSETTLQSTLRISTTELWSNVGMIVLISRFLHIAISIFKTKYLGTMVCFSIDKAVDDGSFLFTFIILAIDSSQLMIMPSAMFPSPWCLIFCILEIFFQIIRIRDCSNRLVQNGAYLLSEEAMIIMCVSFVVVVYASFKIFEHVAFKLYLNIEFQMKATKEKLNCVKFLCEELKDPLQRLSGAFESASSTFLLEDKSQYFARKSFEIIHEIRAMVDRLLLLLKIEEGRFSLQNSSVVSPQELSSMFQRIVIDPLSIPDEDKSKLFSCHVESGIEKVLMDRFVISTILNELYCVIIKIFRRDGPMDTSRAMDFYVQTDSKNLKVKLVANFENNGIPFESSFQNTLIRSNIEKVIENCYGEFQIKGNTIVIELPCLPNDLENSLGTFDSTIHSAKDFDVDNCAEPIKKNLVAYIYVSRPTFIQSGFKMFENAGISCKVISNITEFNVGNPDIVILEHEGIKILLQNEIPNVSDCLLVLLNSGSAYYDNPEEYRGLNIVSLPFPCLFSDVKQICDSYDKKKRLSSMSVANIPPDDASKPNNASSGGGIVTTLCTILDPIYQGASIIFKNLLNEPERKPVIGQKFIYKRRFLMMNLFSLEVEKGFHEWRILNSTMSWIVVLFVFVYVAFRILITVSHIDGREVLVYILMLLGVGLRRRVSEAIDRPISTYWFYFGILLILLQCYGFLQLFVTCSNGSCSLTFSSSKTIHNIYNDSIGGLTYPRAIAVLIFNFQTNHFGWGFFLVWCHGLPIVLMQYFFNIIVLYHLEMSLPNRFLVFLHATFLQSLFVYFASLYKSEYWCRDVYQIMEQNKYSESFVTQAIKEFAQDYEIPSKDLLSMRSAFFGKIQSQLSRQSYDINDEFIKIMNDLNLGYLLQKIIHDQVSSLGKEKIFPREFLDCEHEHVLLEEELLRVAKVFEDGNNIKVFVVVDPELSFIKLKLPIFRALLVNMLRSARTKLIDGQEITVMVKLDSVFNTDPLYQPEPGFFNLVILDTGSQQIRGADDLSHQMFSELTEVLDCNYQQVQLDHNDFNNLQTCRIPYEEVPKPMPLLSTCHGDIISVNRTASKAYHTIKRINTTPKSTFNALVIDTDAFTLSQVGKLLNMSDWKVTLISCVDKLSRFNDVSSINIVIIDDRANRHSIASSGIDIAMCVRMMGFPFAIVALTNSLGEKPSSHMFTDSLAKPLIDASIQRLQSISLNNFGRHLLFC